MPRGQRSKVGETNTSANGYHYIRTEEGWRLRHHVIAEEQLGRRITQDDIVRFKDRDRNNLDPDNIEVIPRKKGLRAQLARVESKIMELELERDRLKEEIAKQNGAT